MRRTIATGLLLSSLFFTAVADASPPSDNASAITPRVSTGVTPPRLLNSLELIYSDSLPHSFSPPVTQVQVSFVVDATGQPRNVQIVRGINAQWDASLVRAVSRLRYQPASMDNRPIPMAVTLNINLGR
jgi:TonB family protein